MVGTGYLFIDQKLTRQSGRLLTGRVWVRVPPGQLNIRGSSNGRTPDSGSGYLGSNPSPRANMDLVYGWKPYSRIV